MFVINRSRNSYFRGSLRFVATYTKACHWIQRYIPYSSSNKTDKFKATLMINISIRRR
jgi:hypothetical protein